MEGRCCERTPPINSNAILPIRADKWFNFCSNRIVFMSLIMTPFSICKTLHYNDNDILFFGAIIVRVDDEIYLPSSTAQRLRLVICGSSTNTPLCCLQLYTYDNSGVVGRPLANLCRISAPG